MFLRYIILIVIAIPNFFIFYLIFTPLTIYPVFYLINLFANATIYGKVISFNEQTIEIVGACVAGSAFYLLTILNLSTPNIKLKKRIYMLLISYLIFLIINILRIVLLSFLLYTGSPYFDVTHKILWYSLSTIFVLVIWFSEVKYFNIKSIPAYSDVKYLYNQSSFSNWRKKWVLLA